MEKNKLSVGVQIAYWFAMLIQIFYVISVAYIGFVAKTADPIHAFTLAIPLVMLIILKRHTA